MGRCFIITFIDVAVALPLAVSGSAGFNEPVLGSFQLEVLELATVESIIIIIERSRDNLKYSVVPGEMTARLPGGT